MTNSRPSWRKCKADAQDRGGRLRAGGKHFHTPFIDAAEGCALAGIMARAEGTITKVRADGPDTPVFPSLAAMIEARVCEAVTVTTPPQTRRALVLAAIRAGLHVVADKPFAPDYEGAMELDAAAKTEGVTLGVYQNRRYDADLQTMKKVIDDGRIGRVWKIESRMDQDSPQTLEAGPTGGLLRDLGSHVVDQMSFVRGPVETVDAQLDMIDLPEGPTDASFTMTLRHEDGAHSHLSASKLNYIDDRELRAIGDLGRHVSRAIDIQAQDLFAGKRPADDLAAWGCEPEANWGTLRTSAGSMRIPSEQGRYHDYCEAFGRAVREETPPRSPPRQEHAHSLFSTPHAKARPRGDRFHSEPANRLPREADERMLSVGASLVRPDHRRACNGGRFEPQERFLGGVGPPSQDRRNAITRCGTTTRTTEVIIAAASIDSVLIVASADMHSDLSEAAIVSGNAVIRDRSVDP
ncbi:MAG: Gfo/Idh/MocA family oxidoreductase [Boseongicola sp.]|nr:Gfo/Idh/MocA family oxidoreductase [Boseongicola sp.]